MYIECFEIFRQKWEGYGYDIGQINHFDLDRDPVLKDIISEVAIELDKLVKQSNTKFLGKRINKILKRRSVISVREGKLLKSLVFKLKQKDDNIDFSKLTYYFPGKSDVYLKKQYYKVK